MQELLQNPFVLILIQLWTLPWKGLALWISAKKSDKKWFIALLLIQTLGILDIIYIVLIAKYDLKSLFQQLMKKINK